MIHTIGKIAVIAEIGTSHGGSMKKARELIDAARDSGADIAKFQIVYAEEILHPDTGFVQLPGGDIRLFDRFKELEAPPSFFREIKEYCDKKGIGFLCSPFGTKSLTELAELNPQWIKIASPELNHLPLLRSASELGIPLILSSGVSRLGDIEQALEMTKKAPERILLHCITSYPAPEDEYNISVLGSLAAVFGVRVGVSDHSLDPVLVPLAAAANGACMIEKHICLSRSDPGLDDPVALPPEQFARMTVELRKAEGRTPEAVLEDLKARYGDAKTAAVLGDGVKRLAESERANYGRTNRSLHYLRSMKSGESIREEDIGILRTEKILTPGLDPEMLERVIGGELVRDVDNGAGVSLADLVRSKR